MLINESKHTCSSSLSMLLDDGFICITISITLGIQDTMSAILYLMFFQSVVRVVFVQCYDEEYKNNSKKQKGEKKRKGLQLDLHGNTFYRLIIVIPLCKCYR